MRMRYIVICGLSGFTIFFPHYLTNSTIKKKFLNIKCVLISLIILSGICLFAGFGGLEVACWPLVPKFAGSNPAEDVRCRRFSACKRSLELRGNRILDKICRNISRPRRVPPSAARGLSRRWTWRHLTEKVGTSKGGGKQWQTTPKNLPRMQCARAIPVAWLGYGSC